MRFVIVPMLMLLAVSITACNENQGASGKRDASEKQAATSKAAGNIDSLFDAYYSFKKRINPVEATKAGYHEYNAQLANYVSDPYKQDLLKQYNSFLEALKVYDSTKVTPAQRLSIGVMKWDCEIKLEGLNNQLVTVASPMYDMPTFELFPLTQMQSLHLYFSQLADGSSLQPFKTLADYDNWLTRVDAYLVFLDTCIAKINLGISKSITLPKVIIKKDDPAGGGGGSQNGRTKRSAKRCQNFSVPVQVSYHIKYDRR